MRKIKLLMMIAVAIVCCVSCNDKKKMINKTEIELYQNEEFQLEVVNGIPDAPWFSTNDYAVSVSEDGLVKANFVGEAEVSSSGMTCKVKVLSRLEKKYELPFMKRGFTYYEMVEMYGEADHLFEQSDSTWCIYDSINGFKDVAYLACYDQIVDCSFLSEYNIEKFDHIVEYSKECLFLISHNGEDYLENTDDTDDIEELYLFGDARAVENSCEYMVLILGEFEGTKAMLGSHGYNY